jgi:hypothetical protein
MQDEAGHPRRVRSSPRIATATIHGRHVALDVRRRLLLEISPEAADLIREASEAGEVGVPGESFAETGIPSSSSGRAAIIRDLLSAGLLEPLPPGSDLGRP